MKQEGTMAGTLKRIGDRLIPAPVTVKHSATPGRPDLEVVFDVIDGELQCRQVVLTATNGEIRSKDLRDVNINALRETVVANWSMAPQVVEGQATVTLLDMPSTEDESRAAVRSYRAQRRKSDNEHLRHVAEVYKSAERAPTQAVADAFDVAHRTAGLYVQRARQAGLLPASNRGSR